MTLSANLNLCKIYAAYLGGFPNQLYLQAEFISKPKVEMKEKRKSEISTAMTASSSLHQATNDGFPISSKGLFPCYTYK